MILGGELMATLEVVFTGHPRPTSDDPAMRDIVDLPSDRRRSGLPIDSPNSLELVGATRWSIFGDVAFLMRYMIGRY